MKKTINYINGDHSGISKKELSVFNPTTGEEISKVILSNNEDFKNVIES